MNISKEEILETGRNAILSEIRSLSATRDLLSDGFVEAVQLIVRCTGRIVTMGIGKSGIVARKIASTFTSTGTSAVFVHPVECLHGDMGMIGSADIVIILSNSGESEEIRRLVMFLRNRKIPIIAITSRIESHLAQSAQIVLRIAVPSEASSLDLVPMASTTAQMAIGDAIASALVSLRKFTPDDFAMFHPGGPIGKRLLLKVADIMHSGDELPVVTAGTPVRESLIVMSEKSMGAVVIADISGKLLGILTDGDLRRAIQKHRNIFEMQIDHLMTVDPISTSPASPAIDALHLMENRSSQIGVLPVIDAERRILGIVRLHDLVMAGLS